MKDDAGRLRDMLEAIDKIALHVGGRRVEFESNELLQVWAVYHLQVVGEAASRISRELLEAHPEVPWSRIVAMRNIIVHDYLSVDMDIVWRAVERDLPPLKKQLQSVLKDLDTHS
jgi:uncharacterized protein with HEPN domain